MGTTDLETSNCQSWYPVGITCRMRMKAKVSDKGMNEIYWCPSHFLRGWDFCYIILEGLIPGVVASSISNLMISFDSPKLYLKSSRLYLNPSMSTYSFSGTFMMSFGKHSSTLKIRIDLKGNHLWYHLNRVTSSTNIDTPIRLDPGRINLLHPKQSISMSSGATPTISLTPRGFCITDEYF